LYHRTTTSLNNLVREHHWYLAAGLVILMFGLGITSMVHQSAIVDEVAHIPAAYAYDHFGDYRLNPEHPPLIKNLAGLPLQFMQVQFPSNEAGWTTEINGQWDTGWNFLYYIGNNASNILFWARLPILLLAVSFGFLLYWYSRRHWGVGAGLLVLFFYTLSPNILAHARYVTTDVGASVFIFIALITFLRFIRVPSGSNVLLLSLALAAANLAKFNSVLLYPFILAVAVIAAWVGQRRLTELRIYLWGTLGASVLSAIWIYLYYIPNTINMPSDVQINLINGSLTYGFGLKVAGYLTGLAHISLLKPAVQYLLGLTMVLGRVEGGNVTYFNGMVTNGSYHWYFPELFVFKTQVAFLVLMVVTAVAGLALWWRGRHTGHVLLERLKRSIRQNLDLWTLGLFAAFYFAISVAGNLNLGIRHILPVYLPLFVVVAVGTVRVARRLAVSRWRALSAISLTLLVGWYGLSTILAYPSYTSYFNELIGGSANADKYFSDSGVDWGQDLLNLKAYVDQHHITQFALDYFGGADPRYYFCARSYDANGQLVATADGFDCSHSAMTEWHAQNGPYTGQYIAVSETYLENDRYYSALDGTPGYAYLRATTPIAKIGGSIYLFKLY
jgi:hypothetical protein